MPCFSLPCLSKPFLTESDTVAATAHFLNVPAALLDFKFSILGLSKFKPILVVRIKIL
jgi:hypothetical protein